MYFDFGFLAIDEFFVVIDFLVLVDEQH